MTPQQAYGGLLYYECDKGHRVVVGDDWPKELNRPCDSKKKDNDPACGAPSRLIVLKGQKPQ